MPPRARGRGRGRGQVAPAPTTRKTRSKPTEPEPEPDSPQPNPIVIRTYGHRGHTAEADGMGIGGAMREDAELEFIDRLLAGDPALHDDLAHGVSSPLTDPDDFDAALEQESQWERSSSPIKQPVARRVQLSRKASVPKPQAPTPAAPRKRTEPTTPRAQPQPTKRPRKKSVASAPETPVNAARAKRTVSFSNAAPTSSSRPLPTDADFPPLPISPRSRSALIEHRTDATPHQSPMDIANGSPDTGIAEGEEVINLTRSELAALIAKSSSALNMAQLADNTLEKADGAQYQGQGNSWTRVRRRVPGGGPRATSEPGVRWRPARSKPACFAESYIRWCTTSYDYPRRASAGARPERSPRASLSRASAGARPAITIGAGRPLAPGQNEARALRRVVPPPEYDQPRPA
ncbi:hypothetical protein C8R43DRAFT_1138940 [Mycena crocata]|nr:hypothetical protein C8R43DRAFT_1138940 [Mycena crocata]